MMFDFTPLYRSSVGFDRMAQLLGELSNTETPSYPPYNIERVDEHSYRITMAVAGFTADDLDIEIEQGTLKISGKQGETADSDSEFLHRGIARRAFERRFRLADHVEIVSADMEHGLLHVLLKREIPEAMKPRRIAINTNARNGKVIEGKKAA